MSSLYETENNTIQPLQSNFTSVNSESAQQQCRAYIIMLKKSIKELHAMLKIRLRVEFPDSIQVLSQLNEKLLTFSELGAEVENLYQDLLEQSKIYKEGMVKAQKYDKLMIRLQEIEQTYKQQNEELVQKTRQLEEENIEKQKKIEQISQELLQKMEESSNFKIKSESLENDIKLKVSEMNRVSIERDNIKRQSQNLNSLLKQVNEEKEVKTQKMQSMVEEKIEDLKEELNRVKDHYQKKIFDKDNIIEKLERELQLTKKELELNAEFTFLQSSISNSGFQSFNTQNAFQNQPNSKFTSHAPLPKSSQPSSATAKNQKEDMGQFKNNENKKETLRSSSNSNLRKQDKYDIEDDLEEELNEYTPKQGLVNKKDDLNEATDRQRHSQSFSKLESPFTRHSTKEETAIRTSRESKKFNLSSIQNNQDYEQEEGEDDTLAQLSDNSEENHIKAIPNKQGKLINEQQNSNSSRSRKQEEDIQINRKVSSQSNNDHSRLSGRQHYDNDADDLDEDEVLANQNWKKQNQLNKPSQHQNSKDQDDQDENSDDNNAIENNSHEEEDEEEEEDEQIHHQMQKQQQKIQQNRHKGQVSEEEDDDHSVSGDVMINDDEFSENDSIDQEVKRRLQLKQSEKKKPMDFDNLKSHVAQNRSFENSSKNQSNYSTVQPSRNLQEKREDILTLNPIKSPNNLVMQQDQHKRNLSYDKQQYDQDSDESLERNAEQIRALQKKRNQQKFEENKKKLMQQKQMSQQGNGTSEEDD